MNLDIWNILKNYEISKFNHNTKVIFPCRSTLFLEPHIQFRDCEVDVESIGSYTYLGGGGGLSSVFRHVKSIGRFCAIAGKVRTGEFEHPTKLLSTHQMLHCSWENVWPSLSEYYKKNKQFLLMAENAASLDISKRSSKIIIGNDVWIGFGAYIRRGVTIGDGSVVATNAVVTKDIPPYSIAGGSPIKILKYRFSEKIIERLTAISWWNYGLPALDGVDISDINGAISHIEDNIIKLQPWVPQKIAIKLNRETNKLSAIPD